LSAIQEAYLKQYMAQVELIQQRSAAARAGTLDAHQYQDLKDLKTELAIAKGISPSQSHSHQGKAWDSFGIISSLLIMNA
jgi:hypothetical protein